METLSGWLKEISGIETMRDILLRFWDDERGDYTMDFLMIFTFGVLPLMATVLLLQKVLKEYVAFGQIWISSPFF